MGLFNAFSEGFKRGNGGISEIIWDIKNVKTPVATVGLIGGIIGALTLLPSTTPVILALAGGVAAGPASAMLGLGALMYGFKFMKGFAHGLTHDPEKEAMKEEAARPLLVMQPIPPRPSDFNPFKLSSEFQANAPRPNEQRSDAPQYKPDEFKPR